MKRIAINDLFIAALMISAVSCGQSRPSAISESGNDDSLSIVKADEQPDFTENESPRLIKVNDKWGLGIANGGWETPPTRIVVIGNEESSKEYTHAVSGNKMLKIKYIGEKKTKGEPTEFDFYFETYDNTVGSEYEIIGSNTEGFGGKTFFLYSDSEKWGGVPDNIIIHSMNYSYDEPRPTASKAEIAAMEKQQNGRKIIYSEVFAEFSIDGKSNRLMLMRYQNTNDGLFKIVLRDHNNDYFTADYPCELYDGEASWRADLPDDPGLWEILFVGRVSEGLFIVSTWSAPEGRNIMFFVAKDGKLQEVER